MEAILAYVLCWNTTVLFHGHRNPELRHCLAYGGLCKVQEDVMKTDFIWSQGIV